MKFFVLCNQYVLRWTDSDWHYKRWMVGQTLRVSYSHQNEEETL